MLSARNIFKSFGPQVVADDLTLTIQSGERVGLVGDNGAGKSTLAKIIAGQEASDGGTTEQHRGARILYLEQSPAFAPGQTAREAALEGLGDWSRAKARYDEVVVDLEKQGASDLLLQEQGELIETLERLGGWEPHHRIDAILQNLGVTEPDKSLAQMSGGEKRRVALARLLLASPDLAILDEPTNHLDIEAIEWLEEHLNQQFAGALLLITHDRTLLDKVVTRTCELSHGKLYSFEGGWSRYLEQKALRMEHEARQEANRQNFLRSEIEWLRRSPKARSTKQKARIDRAHEAIAAKPQAKRKEISLTGQYAPRLGNSVIELEDLQVERGGRTLIRGFDFILQQGQRIGVIGPNGAGKSSLLTALCGDLQPNGGRIKKGKHTKLAFLTQTRSGLDGEASIQDNVCGQDKQVWFDGKAVDVRAWLGRFGFDREKQHQKVHTLSGGEKARVALAQMLLSEANVLLLDEPTNDLDVGTLGALEHMLVEGSRTAVVVTHDRYFLNRIATGLIVFESEGTLRFFPGNYDSYLSLRRQQVTRPASPEAPLPHPRNAHKGGATQSSKRKGKKKFSSEESPSRNSVATSEATQTRSDTTASGTTASFEVQAPQPKKLTYAERIELEGMMERIEASEKHVTTLQNQLADPKLYKEQPEEAPKLQAELNKAEALLTTLMERWEHLEERKAQA